MKYQLARAIGNFQGSVWVEDAPPVFKVTTLGNPKTGRYSGKTKASLTYETNVLDGYGRMVATVSKDDVELQGLFIEDPPLITFEQWKAAGYQAVPRPNDEKQGRASNEPS